MNSYTIDAGDGEISVVEIENQGKIFRFSFDPSQPTEGVTLTGVFEAGQRLIPADFLEQAQQLIEAIEPNWPTE